MVSKRQKLAKQRFKEANPELFPKAEPTPPSDPNKKKKKRKKSSLKPKSKDPKNPIKKSASKHPLRVPGMKPGESCYICRENNHIAKNCPEKSQWEKNKTCLQCRRRGHSLKNCPNKNDSSSEKFCYNCGESSHTLANCSRPIQDGGTKYAVCFICKGLGHLSKNCLQNTHGIYPEGGCCEICQEKTHLRKDCPQKVISVRKAPNAIAGLDGRPTGRVTKFSSGDDLEDDFMVVEDVVEDSKLTKKQGPKVINFVG